MRVCSIISYLFIFLFVSVQSNLLSIGDWGGYNLGSYHKLQALDVAQQIVNDTLQNKYDAILNTGDNFYYCGIQNIYDENIKHDYIYLFDKLNLEWINSLGNHDYGYNVSAQIELTHYLPYWYMPQRYYKKELDDFVLYVLDTNPCIRKYRLNNPDGWDPCGTEYPTCTPYKITKPCLFHSNIIQQNCSQQYVWFKQEIESLQTNKWVIVIGHHPVYELDVEPFIDIIENDKINLYVNGHVHILGHYRYDKREKYITNGAGSMVSNNSIFNHMYYNWYRNKPGYIRHSIVNENILKNEFIDVKGNIMHSFYIYK